MEYDSQESHLDYFFHSNENGVISGDMNIACFIYNHWFVCTFVPCEKINLENMEIKTAKFVGTCVRFGETSYLFLCARALTNYEGLNPTENVFRLRARGQKI